MLPARYELWCMARAAAARYCMVACETPLQCCREWNAARAGPTYAVGVFEELSARFETPDRRNRWDSPLFRTMPGHADTPSILQVPVMRVISVAHSSHIRAGQRGGGRGREKDWASSTFRGPGCVLYLRYYICPHPSSSRLFTLGLAAMSIMPQGIPSVATL
jgi:hypothetical protein